MKAELIDVSETKKNLDIEIPQDVVDHEILHIAQDLAKKARVPGFRPGKAPIHVVKTRFRDEIMSEMLHHLLPKYFDTAVEERKLEVIHTPSFENVDYASGQPLKFKAVFEVFPALNIANYKGVPVDEVTVAVADEEIDDTLKRLQDEGSEMVPLEESRPIKESDFADIAFEGTFQGTDDPPISADKASVEIGAPTTLKDFSDNLTGMSVGEEKAFSVTYREDYPEKRLAGKTVEYKVTVEAVKEKKLPELNDEFAQGYGAYTSLDELKAKIRGDIEKHKLEHANDQAREKMLEWLEDNNTFEAPDSLVERQLEVRLQRMLRDLARRGINPQQLDVDWAKIREDQRAQAIRDVKGSLILEYVADAENVEVSDEDIENEIQSVANETHQALEKVREVLTRDGGVDRLKGQIRNRKTLDFMQSNAQVRPAIA